MHPHDRPDGLPTLTPSALPTPPLVKPVWDDFSAQGEAAGPRPRLITPKIIWRAFRRHWWQILALWTVASAALVALAYLKIKPTYEAIAWLRVDSSSPLQIAQRTNASDLSTSMETQVALITSPDVLSDAVHEPKVATLPRVRNSIDPETELRKELRVGVLRGTQLIQVAMATESPTEAATIVNAVVHSFLKVSEDWTDYETKLQISQLRETRKRFQVQLDDLRTTLEKLADKLTDDPRVENKDGKAVTVSEYHRFKTQLADIEVRRIMAEQDLIVLQAAYNNTRPSRAGNRQRVALEGQELEAAITKMFYRDPEVAQVRADMQKAQRQLKELKRLTPKFDPAARLPTERLADLEARYEDLWNEKHPEIEFRLTQEANLQADKDPLLQRVEDAQIEVKQLKAQALALTERLAKLEIQTKSERKDALALQFAQADHDYTKDMLTMVDRSLNQLDYEARGGGTKVRLAAEARPQFKPISTKRWTVMAAVPVGVLALVLGLFVLVEARSGRVGDPDDLPARVRVGVIGVVPPLPSLQAPGRGLKGLRDEKRRVEEFVQSLDHLRVILCSGGTAGRRCVLITSACGGEGKTTLAAQLAGRCANAGLLTLLIDADLRRPSLGELLEVPEGPGLADVLVGEAEPESTLVVVGNAGGFHLMPAGTLGHDPSRLLQGERLGQLIAQFRATFDVVIVDAPPVLAVPDALLLGRWTDGAVLAVRHDTSRYPLVERANRRLAAVDIPVLGAVVNGVRTMESSYGAYHYGAYHYASSAGTEAAPAEDGPAPA